ncbi:DUF2891 domain-containing protein [Phaeacidiphilus oryzae]|uniref:DUF2891 domain-containing protein n=1 Tax=Phaeacidiphilus oryzae TaxID=348818 RepID=UPI00055C270A|nr:DUF2891 domain-containing protein [Phaeacidiphilus oryzae]
MIREFTRLALANIDRAYPYAPGHLLTGPQDLVPPRERHPVFAGSYDWHSSVHMHWLLVRVLRTDRADLDPGTASAAESLLDRQLTPAGIAQEARFLLGHPSFERPYGWAWLLALAAECAGTRWAGALAPGADAVAELLLDWLPKAAYPVRHGVHANSAFALGLVLDSAEAAGHPELLRPVRRRLLDWFREDHDAPVHWEPSGQDFLSPALTEADAMRRVLPAGEFAEWLRGFLPSFGPLLTPPRITDPSDPQIGHLIGLCLTRATSLRAYAPEAADAHLAAARSHLSSTDFTTAHWLATFALRAGLR